jgi:DUF4097 and DUF4098 domain-containing protein YvlB
MPTSDERLRILKMIQEGRITADEGVQLLEAIGASDSRASGAEKTSGGTPRWIRIRVSSIRNGKVKVNVRMPVSVIKAGMKMGAKFSPEVEGLDSEQLMGFIQAGTIGPVINVYDDVDDEHVEVFLE